MALHDLRRDYTLSGLDEADLDPDPIAQFRTWFAQAEVARGYEPHAMTVATADADGNPSARTVLLKGLDERGFVFFTNYESQKGEQLAANPRAELLFFWPEVERQVRIHGTVERLSGDESQEYFRGRPRGSQLAARVSAQSRVIPDRATLEAAWHALMVEYQDSEVPMPEFWGGYRVVPSSIEFWQGRVSRLHDRLRCRRNPDGSWVVERLAP